MSAIRPRSRIGIVLAALTALALAIAGPASAHGDGKGADVYKKRNLVSDIDGVARITDANLVNPWGLAFGPATPAWVSDNGDGRLDAVLRRRAQEHPRDPAARGRHPGRRSNRGGLQRHRRLQGRRRPGPLHLRLRGRDDHRVERGHAGRDRGDDARGGLQGPGHREQGQRDDALRRELPHGQDRRLQRRVRAGHGPRAASPTPTCRPASRRSTSRRSPGAWSSPSPSRTPTPRTSSTARASATSTSSTRAATCCGGWSRRAP